MLDKNSTLEEAIREYKVLAKNLIRANDNIQESLKIIDEKNERIRTLERMIVALAEQDHTSLGQVKQALKCAVLAGGIKTEYTLPTDRNLIVEVTDERIVFNSDSGSQIPIKKSSWSDKCSRLKKSESIYEEQKGLQPYERLILKVLRQVQQDQPAKKHTNKLAWVAFRQNWLKYNKEGKENA